MNHPIAESVVGPDPRPLAIQPLLPWDVPAVRRSLEKAQRTQAKSEEGRAALANVVQACRAALAEYESCPPHERLRRSQRRFDAMVEYRARAIEDAHTEADDWPPSRAAVQDALDVLQAEGCIEATVWPPSQAAVQDAAGGEMQPQHKPKGAENLSPMQIAVLMIVLEFGGTPDEVTDRLSAEYERPPTRRSVIEADERRLQRTGGAPRPQGNRRERRANRRAPRRQRRTP